MSRFEARHTFGLRVVQVPASMGQPGRRLDACSRKRPLLGGKPLTAFPVFCCFLEKRISERAQREANLVTVDQNLRRVSFCGFMESPLFQPEI